MRTILLATRNTHKTGEFAELLGAEFDIRDLSADDFPNVAETGATFEENARLKALAASQFKAELVVVADDSGLEVEALDGEPGIFSARYAGFGASDEANVRKLLTELERCGARTKMQRAARFRCVLVAARGGEVLHVCEGAVEGSIAEHARGTKGFGYDPIFIPNGYDHTFAEAGPIVKQSISHRARAVAGLRRFLNEIRSTASSPEPHGSGSRPS